MFKYNFKKIKFLSLLALALNCVTLSSCSAFFDSGYLIKNITTNVDENGDTTVTIEFDDDSIKPVTFTIPRGISGKDGVGIEKIVPQYNSDSGILTITISYTDENVEDTVVNVPVLSGTDGRGVENVSIELDDLGNTVIQFIYTDGTLSEKITLKKGVDGKGIDYIETLQDVESNSTILIVHYNDGTQEEPIYVKNGNDAVGIATIDVIDNTSSFILSILFSDGSHEDLEILKPSVNKWRDGNGVPSNKIGNEGDFYFDSESGSVYKKMSDYWNLLFSMSGTGTTINYRVRFDTNGGSWRYVDMQNPDSQKNVKEIIVPENSFIDLNSNDYAVINDGHIFNGWWTDPIITPNSGHFTVLTPVNCDLTLYANWVE